MSVGGLVDRGIPNSSLTIFCVAVRLGRVWIYHHADRSLHTVQAEVPFSTFSTTLPASACE